MKYIKNLLLAIIFIPIVLTAIPIIPKKKDQWSNHPAVVLGDNYMHLLKCLLFTILISIYFIIRYFTS